MEPRRRRRALYLDGDAERRCVGSKATAGVAQAAASCVLAWGRREGECVCVGGSVSAGEKGELA